MDLMELFGTDTPLVRDALISPCGKYRYWLTRRWGPGKTLPYLMLNPSTADALKDDQTVRRCMYFAKREGYDAIVVLNLYAYRATHPEDLVEASHHNVDVMGPDNLHWISEYTKDARQVILAWGGMSYVEEEFHRQAMKAVFQALPRDVTYLCLGATANESPRHPSRLGNDARFEEYLPDIRWLPEDSVVARKILGS